MHARGQHGVDVLGVGADGGNQAARAVDARAREHLFPARVGLDGEPAAARAPDARAPASRSTTTNGTPC